MRQIVRSRVFVAGARVALVLSCIMIGTANAEPSRSSGDGKSLQAMAADPTEPLVQMSVFNDFVPDTRKGKGVANQVLLQPVIPLPAFSRFPAGQILRPSIPIITTPGPDRVTTIGDITLFDLFTPERVSSAGSGDRGVNQLLVQPIL